MTRGYSYLFLGVAIGAASALAVGGAPASITATGQDGIALFRKDR